MKSPQRKTPLVEISISCFLIAYLVRELIAISRLAAREENANNQVWDTFKFPHAGEIFLEVFSFVLRLCAAQDKKVYVALVTMRRSERNGSNDRASLIYGTPRHRIVCNKIKIKIQFIEIIICEMRANYIRMSYLSRWVYLERGTYSAWIFQSWAYNIVVLVGWR